MVKIFYTKKVKCRNYVKKIVQPQLSEAKYYYSFFDEAFLNSVQPKKVG